MFIHTNVCTLQESNPRPQGIAETLSQYDKKHDALSTLSGLRVGRRRDPIQVMMIIHTNVGNVRGLNPQPRVQ
jgi:hypothetical protein